MSLTSLSSAYCNHPRRLSQTEHVASPPAILPLSKGCSTYRGKRREQLPFRRYGLWRVISGYVRTYTWNDDGGFVPLGFWASGDIFGYPIAQIMPYSAECMTAVEAEQLDLAYRSNVEAVRAQAKQYSDLLRIAHCRQAELRLLQFLCWLSLRFGSATSTGRRVHFRLSHQEIAETIGSTRVTVTRLLKKLEREGHICWTPKVRQINHSALEKTYFEAYPPAEISRSTTF